jgi:hypothetical protein
MINNHFALFQLPGKMLKTKKMCSLFSWQHAISYLLFFILVQYHPRGMIYDNQVLKMVINHRGLYNRSTDTKYHVPR